MIFSKGKNFLFKLCRPRSWNKIFTISLFLIVTIKKNREMQNQDGTTMERAEMKKKRKYGRDQIKLSKDQIFQSYLALP
jgi:hypothetical protein